MAEGEITIGGALSYAWSILSHNWRAIWGILALNALGWTVLFAGMFARHGDLVAAGMAAVTLTKYPVYGAATGSAPARTAAPIPTSSWAPWESSGGRWSCASSSSTCCC